MAVIPCRDFVTDFHFVKELSMRFRINSIESSDESCLRSKPYGIDGGAKEDRTPDLLRARQALSQLSYGPNVGLKQLARQSFHFAPAPFAFFHLGHWWA
jgi:hypothetical protein